MNFKSLQFVCMIVCLVTWGTLSAQQECDIDAPAPVFGTVTGSTGSFTFDNIPTGNVIELQIPNSGIVYTIDMCATNEDGWADGVNDSRLTFLGSNTAGAGNENALYFLDDGCTNGSGADGYGPTFGEYTSTGAGSIFLLLSEWSSDGSVSCIMDGTNSSYTMTVTLSTAPDCSVASAGTVSASDTCVDFGSSFSLLNSDAIVPVVDATYGFRWIVSTAPITSTTDPYNDPAYWGGFGLSDAVYDINDFANDGSSISPGVYYFTCVVFGNATLNEDGDDVATFDAGCTFLSESIKIELKGSGANCDGTGIDCASASGGTISADDCVELNQDVTISVTDATVPGLDTDAGALWVVFSAPRTAENPLEDEAYLGNLGVDATPANVTLSNNGALPPGTYYFSLATFGSAVSNQDTLILNADCIHHSNELAIEFKADGESCSSTAAKDISAVTHFEMGPNPTSDILRTNIQFDASYDVEVTVTDMNGKTIWSDARSNVSEAAFTLNMADKAAGVYFVTFKANGQSFTERVLKQ